MPHFARTIETPPLCSRSPSPVSLQPSLHPFVSPGRLIFPPSPVFVRAVACLLGCLHARLWFLPVCVCLHQKPQPHRNERGAMGRHTGPGSRWGHPQHQRSILSGPAAAPRQTLPGLVLEWSGDHPAGVWRPGPGVHKERLQAVRRYLIPPPVLFRFKTKRSSSDAAASGFQTYLCDTWGHARWFSRNGIRSGFRHCHDNPIKDCSRVCFVWTGEKSPILSWPDCSLLAAYDGLFCVITEFPHLLTDYILFLTQLPKCTSVRCITGLLRPFSSIYWREFSAFSYVSVLY